MDLRKSSSEPVELPQEVLWYHLGSAHGLCWVKLGWGGFYWGSEGAVCEQQGWEHSRMFLEATAKPLVVLFDGF